MFSVIAGEWPSCSASSGIDRPARTCSDANAWRRSYGGSDSMAPPSRAWPDAPGPVLPVVRAPRLAIRTREQQTRADARRQQVLADVALDRLQQIDRARMEAADL